MNSDGCTIRSSPPLAHGRRFVPPLNESTGDWELAVCGDLTDHQVELTTKLVEVPSRSKGTIFFDSCGGSAYVGLSLASLIRLRGLETVGVVVSECSSSALLPFAACSRRYVTHHATLLFHPIRWQSAEEVRLEEAAEWARHFQLLEKDLDQLLARLFDYPAEKLAEWTRPGRFVTGEEFAETGLAQLVDLFSGDIWSQIERQTLKRGKPCSSDGKQGSKVSS